MAQFKILECDETGSTKYYAVRIEIAVDGITEIADCVVTNECPAWNYDANRGSSYWEIVSVDPDELYETVKKLEDEIIEAM